MPGCYSRIKSQRTRRLMSEKMRGVFIPIDDALEEQISSMLTLTKLKSGQDYFLYLHYKELRAALDRNKPLGERFAIACFKGLKSLGILPGLPKG